MVFDSDGTAKQTILVVDDTPDNLMLLGELLMPYYDVHVANSGPKALIAANAEPRPDLILLDIMMPGMDGYAVIRQLKSRPETRDIPVVFISALNHTEDEAQGLALGATDYISKPIRPAIVLARVRGQLEIKAARDLMRDRNRWLQAEVERRVMQYQKVQDITLRALASLAEARDNETGKHILRTQTYVRILATDLAQQAEYREALPPAVIELYAKAAPLHDIGKVGIPDHVLYKRGKLTPDEWVIMKTHAQIGADAIQRALTDEEDQEAVDFLHVAMDIAAGHHERWDGSGYPRGLSGERIPLAARLMALADVFDALVTRRVYKPPMSVETASGIINKDSGSHFDPAIVAAFNRHIEDFRAVARRHADEVPDSEALTDQPA